MEWLGYISQKCKDKAEKEKHGVLEKVRNFSENIKKRKQDCLNLFEEFNRPLYVKKKFPGNDGRLIAELRKINCNDTDYSVIVFLDFMFRKDKEYENFYNNQQECYEKHYKNQVSYDELKKYIEKLEEERSLKDKAKQLEESGKQNRNPKLLDEAACLYRKSESSEINVQRCQAFALRFKGQYLEAVECGKDASYTFKHECWWLHGEEPSLRKIYDSKDKESDFKQRLEFGIVKNYFKTFKTSNIEEQIKLLSVIYNTYTANEQELFDIKYSTQAWRTVIYGILNRICKRELSQIQADNVWNMCCEFNKNKLDITLETNIMKQIAYNCKKDPEAVELLKNITDEKLVRIGREAEKLSRSLDTRIQSAYSSKNFEEIKNIYQENKGEKFSTTAMQQIAFVYAETGDTSLVENIFRTSCPVDFYKSLIEHNFSSQKTANDICEIFMCSVFSFCDDGIISELLKDKRNVPPFYPAMFTKAVAYCDSRKLRNNVNDQTLYKIFSYIKRFAEQKDKKYRAKNFFEFGCAFEKTNSIKEAKEFYNKEAKNLAKKEERDLAEKRLMICFERHAEIIANEGDKEKQLEKAQKLRTKLKLENIPVGSDELPEFLFGNDPWKIRSKKEKTALASQAKISKPTDSSPSTETKQNPTNIANNDEVIPEVEASSTVVKPSAIENTHVVNTVEKVESGRSESAESLVGIARMAGEALANVCDFQSKLVNLDLKILTEYERNTISLIDCCRKLIKGIASGNLSSKLRDIKSFEQLSENLRNIENEILEEKKKEQYKKFLKDLMELIEKLELIPEYKKDDNSIEDLQDFKEEFKKNSLDVKCRKIPEIWNETLDAKTWFFEIIKSKNRKNWEKFVAMCPYFNGKENRRLFGNVVDTIKIS